MKTLHKQIWKLQTSEGAEMRQESSDKKCKKQSQDNFALSDHCSFRWILQVVSALWKSKVVTAIQSPLPCNTLHGNRTEKLKVRFDETYVITREFIIMLKSSDLAWWFSSSSFQKERKKFKDHWLVCRNILAHVFSELKNKWLELVKIFSCVSLLR